MDKKCKVILKINKQIENSEDLDNLADHFSALVTKSDGCLSTDFSITSLCVPNNMFRIGMYSYNKEEVESQIDYLNTLILCLANVRECLEENKDLKIKKKKGGKK